MKEISRSPTATIYLQVARITARFLASSSAVESVLVHRSVATGEVSFGRSDIDLLIVVAQAATEDGEKLASLCKRVRTCRYVNPLVNHIEVLDPDSISNYAETDTWWASLERRSAILLRGKPITIPALPINPDHVAAKLGFWIHWFISQAIQRKDRRNLRKNALECWNLYATAAGLIQEPFLTRREMAPHLRAVEKSTSVERLEDAAYALDFVFELASRLHRQRLAALGPLSKPLVFQAVLAPLSHQRTFVVLPGHGSPLPPEAFLPGSFVCTPEILDLYLHYSDTFLYWVLPSELRELDASKQRVFVGIGFKTEARVPPELASERKSRDSRDSAPLVLPTNRVGEGLDDGAVVKEKQEQVKENPVKPVTPVTEDGETINNTKSVPADLARSCRACGQRGIGKPSPAGELVCEKCGEPLSGTTGLKGDEDVAA